MKLYEISADYAKLMEAIENGEIPEEAIADTLEGIEGAFDDKIDNIACIIKDYIGDIEKLKAEETALAKRRKSLEKSKDWLIQYISNALIVAGKKEFTTTRNKITFRPSEAVVVDDTFIDWAMKNRKDLLSAEVKINKDAIKAALKNGELLDGAMIEKRMNIQVR